MKKSVFKSLYFPKWCQIFDSSPLLTFSKFNNFFWVCWFLAKSLFNFVSLHGKLHNRYYQNSHILRRPQKYDETVKLFLTLLSNFKYNLESLESCLLRIFELYLKSMMPASACALCCWWSKGQLISKCLVGVFNSPKKWPKTIRLEVP